MSPGLSRSMRRIRPVDRAIMRTLLATWAATKSEEMENCNCTLSTLKIGSEASVRSCKLVEGRSCIVGSRAILIFGSMRPVCYWKGAALFPPLVRGEEDYRRDSLVGRSGDMGTLQRIRDLRSTLRLFC